MRREPVSSEALKSVGYDDRLQELQIEFRNGGLYAYEAVPARIFDSLMAAPSRGAYFQENIRDKFKFRQIH